MAVGQFGELPAPEPNLIARNQDGGIRSHLWQDHTMSAPLLSFLSEALGPLPAPARATVTSSRTTEADTGAPVLRAGERWSSLYWVESGALRLYYLDCKGQSANKNLYLDGAMLWPLTPTLAGKAMDFWIETLAPTRFWALPCASAPDWKVMIEHVRSCPPSRVPTHLNSAQAVVDAPEGDGRGRPRASTGWMFCA
jgi:hypothetical protein